MYAWLRMLCSLEPSTPAVRVVVAGVRGSGPRETGASMLVSANDIAGTIGGGNLEHVAIHRARRLLDRGPAWDSVEYPLGPAVGQCCGGVVTLAYVRLAGGDDREWAQDLTTRLRDQHRAFLHTEIGPERVQVSLHDVLAGAVPDGAKLIESEAGAILHEWLQPTDFTVVLFGAGHVGQALVQALVPLRTRIEWIDQRADMFPAGLDERVVVSIEDDPAAAARHTAANGFHLVMTHSHPLDLEICATLLQRDLPFVGLIGSASKRAGFHRRLRKRGLEAQLPRLVCPIGIDGIRGKRPAEIAASVAAQLLIEYGRGTVSPASDQPLSLAKPRRA